METHLPFNERPLTYKEWALNIFLTSLPLVGFILLLVWAFSDGGNIHRQAWAKGYLFIFVIFIVIFLVFVFVFGGLALLGGILSNR